MIYDSGSPSVEQFRSDLAKQQPVTRAPAGFSESFMQELGHFWRENLSISRLLALDSAQSERAQRIRELAGDQAFIKTITVPGDPQTQKMVDAPAAEHESIQTDSELMGDIRERNRDLRQERDAALRLQTTGGKIGGLAGTMVGALSDPIVLGTLPLGASWATGVVRTMLTEAGINMAIETAIQPAVTAYKKELDSPYSVGEAITNIGAAGLGAAALSGIVKGAAAGVRRIGGFDDMIEAAERVPNPTTEQRAAIDTLRQHADSLRQSPFAERPEFDSLHLDALAKASDDIANSRPVDLNRIIEQPQVRDVAARPVDIDPEEAISIEATRQRVSEILETNDVTIRMDDGTQRSAREVFREMDEQAEAAETVLSCLAGR